jgi:GT2 family glycosyltransferase
MAEHPSVSALICVRDGQAYLPEAIDSALAQTLPPAEVIVVDGASTDASADVAARRGVRFLQRKNRGLGHLYNEGAQAASSPFVFLANNDVALDPRCLELLAAALERDDKRFAADPRQMDWSGTRLVHARARLSRGPMLRQVLPGFQLDLVSPAQGVVPTVSANGGAMLVRTERMLALGGFDETMFMDFEDIDLCWRAWLRGWPSVYVSDAWLRHRVGAATDAGVLTRRLTSSHHNLVRFALKCFPATEAVRVVAGELLRLPGHPRLIAPALADVARELPEIARQRRQIRPSRRFFDWCLEGMN